MTSTKLRRYFMALLDRRRVPIRIARANIAEVRATAREWWDVEAPSAKAARALCLAWPQKAQDTELRARITNHGRKRD